MKYNVATVRLRMVMWIRIFTQMNQQLNENLYAFLNIFCAFEFSINA